MPITIGQAQTGLVSDALSATKVGVWEWEVQSDRMRVDAPCAELFGIPAALAEHALPLSVATDTIHPEDFPLFQDQIAAVIEQGGLFVAEYRTVPRPGETHWILARGRFEAGATGAVMRGRGIVIDITESKHDGHLDEQAVFLSMFTESELAPLHHATDAALIAYRELGRMGTEGEHLRAAAQNLLIALGEELALSTPEQAHPNGLNSKRSH